MFGRKKEENTEIKVIITKTSTQAQHEKDIRNEANRKSKLCPSCGFNSEVNVLTFPSNISRTRMLVIHSQCTKCETHWETRYSY